MWANGRVSPPLHGGGVSPVWIAQLLPRLRGGNAALLGSGGFVRLRVEAGALALGAGVGLAGVCLYIDYA